MMFFYVRLKKTSKGIVYIFYPLLFESIEFNSTKEKEMKEFTKIYRQVDENTLEEYGVKFAQMNTRTSKRYSKWNKKRRDRYSPSGRFGAPEMVATRNDVNLERRRNTKIWSGCEDAL